MTLIQWGPMLQVGFKDIDDQHQRLVELVNELNGAMHAGQGRDVLAKVLGELVRYTQYHFGMEERLMETYKIDTAPGHKAEHAKLIQDVAAFKAKFDGGSAAVSAEIMNFLRDWLSRHILQTDKKFAQALIAKGAKPGVGAAR